MVRKDFSLRKTVMTAVLLILFLTNLLWAEYQIKSPYLQNPELNIAALIKEADFWIKAKDDVNGGFYSYMNAVGEPVFPNEWWWNSIMCDVNFNFYLRQVVGQSRVAYAFSKAYMVTGDSKYLGYARYALDWLYTYGWDQTYGGWHFTTDQFGQLAPWQPCSWWDPNQWKWAYLHMYALLGISAYYEATGSETEYNWLMKGYKLLNDKFWDSRPGYEGYYRDIDLDYQNPRDKGFNEVDAVTTCAMSLYLLTKEDQYKQRCIDVAEAIVNRLVVSMDNPDVKFGMVEEYDIDWNPIPARANGFVGHLLKAAWVLARVYVIHPDQRYLDAAKKLINEVLNNGGYDHTYGGPYVEYNWVSGQISMYKNYWNVEMGFTSGFMNGILASNKADKETFLEMADESLSFFMNHFVDSVNGGYYLEAENDGTLRSSLKGDLWDMGYHGVELHYLTYLYSSLYLEKNPITLYYQFEPAKKSRTVLINPVEVGCNMLKIKHVYLNNLPYYNFNSSQRKLIIPKGISGKFKIILEANKAHGKNSVLVLNGAAEEVLVE